MEQWVILAFLAAFLLAATNLITKHLNSDLNEYSVGWARNFFSLPIFWIVLLFAGIPDIDPRFWPILAIMVPLEVLIAIFFFKAVKLAPLSVVIPLLSFNSIFIAIGAFILLGETLNSTHLLAFGFNGYWLIPY